MLVGLMHNFKKPTHMAKLTTMVAKFKGIDVIYLRPWNVNMKNGTVNGEMFIDNKWIQVKNEIPRIIDISPYCFKYKKVLKYLRNHTYLTDNGKNRISKQRLQEKLANDEYFSQYVIPSSYISSFIVIEEFLNKYEDVVVKPLYSQRGRGIYRITKLESDKYILGHNMTKQEVNLEDIEALYNNLFSYKRYIIQNCIVSNSESGNPFDCRLHVEKNRSGKWEIARKYIRIGIGQQVISNVNQGGGIANPKPFLKANFGELGDKINNKLNELAFTIPYKIEELRETNLMTMGLDVGIDEKGNLYLFEVNSAPATSTLQSEVAMLRTDYYKYLFENKSIRNI